MPPAADTPNPRPPSPATSMGEHKPNDIHEVLPNRTPGSQPAAEDPELAGHPATAQPPTERKTWWDKWGFEVKLIVALLLPVFVETLDYTVVASAQSQIASAFGRLDIETWVGTSYVLTSTAFLPLCSNVSDILGRHAALQVGFVIFFIGSAISTASQNMPMVLAGRGLAGVGAAFLLTVVRVIFADNRSLDTNTLRTAMISLLFAVGYSTGPIIGGALSSVNFRWIFAINLPIALVGSILAFLTIRKELLGPRADPRDALPEWRASTRSPWLTNLTRIDWIGGILFIAGVILVLMGLSWGSTSISGWSEARTIATLTVGSILIVIFTLWEHYLGRYEVLFGDDGQRMYPEKAIKIPPRIIGHTHRMLPLWLFRNHQISVVFYGAFTNGMVLFGCLYFLAIYWSIVAGFENTKTGTQLVYLTPGLGGGVWLSSAMIKWWRQPRYPIWIGQVSLAVATGLLGYAISRNNHDQINGFLAMAGVGIGLTIGTLEMQSRFLLPKEMNSVSTTMNLFFRTAGGTVGLAQLSAVLQSKLRSYITDKIKNGSLSASDAESIISALSSTGGKQSSGPGIAQLSPALQDIVKSAYQYGVKWSFYSLTPWVAVAAVAVFSLGKIVDTDRVEKDRKAREEEEAEAEREKAIELSPITRAERSTAGHDTEPADGEAEIEQKPKKQVGYGPRYKGPFMYLVYGIELLIGTRQRRPKTSTPAQS